MLPNMYSGSPSRTPIRANSSSLTFVGQALFGAITMKAMKAAEIGLIRTSLLAIKRFA